MKKTYIASLIISVIVLVSCAAPVKLAKYPEPGVTEIPESYYNPKYCEQPENHESISVLFTLPEKGTYQPLGSILVSQESTSSLITTSDEEQIKEARIQACKWGADAIVIISSDEARSMTYDVFSGLGSKESKQNRIVAIKFIESE